MITRSSSSMLQVPTSALPLARSFLTNSVASSAAIALAIACTSPPNLAPRVRKFALTEMSTRSPSASAISARSATFNSSAICSRISAGNAAQPLAAMSARCSGWRIFIPDSARAALPNSTILRVRATCADNFVSISAALATGKSDK
ncbi:unannotated protein [freshwater metagenome]|uniref:Unannotated protein n=1 Tax=freshwater metagenome TaxID=449393 RepID=A0A6J6MV13_9ZZZZ